ncbi:3-phosphoshikimate 1-carboxyvinyltransferase [Oscillospiraceae bacterium OttesenSCG-928-G22]|nr:3-phosphoshikimate 1-carboxyvinyltransferase [Oscillospiraceae bacterium OttesenSCG-928-G22]
MDAIRILPGPLAGALPAMPSKSVLHRELIASSLADGISQICGSSRSDDIEATACGLIALSLCSEIDDTGGAVRVRGTPRPLDRTEKSVDCGASASTLRFLLPQALRLGVPVRFTGERSLFFRPLSVYTALLEERGVFHRLSDDSFEVNGTLSPGEFLMRGDESSQYATGLLFALPLLDGDSRIVFTTNPESCGYIDLTRKTLQARGIATRWESERTLYIPGGQAFRPAAVAIEGDYSHAANALVAGALSGDVTVFGLSPDSAQPDRKILDILRGAGASVAVDGESVRVSANSRMAFTCDLSETPDLGPILAAFACGCIGESRLINASRLRLKESDRLRAISEELRKLGADTEESGDSLLVRGTGTLRGGRCSSWGDHRVAMALSMASAIAEGPVVLEGYACVKKSAPLFYREFAALGGRIDGVDVWN